MFVGIPPFLPPKLSSSLDRDHKSWSRIIVVTMYGAGLLFLQKPSIMEEAARVSMLMLNTFICSQRRILLVFCRVTETEMSTAKTQMDSSCIAGTSDFPVNACVETNYTAQICIKTNH